MAAVSTVESSSDVTRQVDDVVDAAVLCLHSYDSLRKIVDVRKVRAALQSEVLRVGDSRSPIILTPLFVYLFSAAKRWFATADVMACVQEIADALEKRGYSVRLPDAYRYSARTPETRTEAARAPAARTPMGTRAGGSFRSRWLRG